MRPRPVRWPYQSLATPATWTTRASSTSLSRIASEGADSGYKPYATLQLLPESALEAERLGSALQEVLLRCPPPAVAPHLATEPTPQSTPRAVEAPSPVSSGGKRTAECGRLASDTDEEWHPEPGVNNQTTRLTPSRANRGTKALLFSDRPSMTPLDDFPEENFQRVQEPPREEDYLFAVPNLHPVTAAAASAEVELTVQGVDRIHDLAASSRPRPFRIHDAQIGDVLLATQEVYICYKHATVVQGSELRITRALHSGSIRCTYYVGRKCVTVYLNEKECEYFVCM